MILNTTTRHSERYKILPGTMGSAGEPPNSPNRHFKIVNGVDRGNGYQGYIAVTYFLENEHGYIPKEAINACITFLQDEGYTPKDMGIE